MIEEKIGRAMEAGEKLRVKSALNPILWLCLIVTVPSTIAATRMDPTPIWLIVLIFIPIALVSIGFLYLLMFDRDKLQSEDYQIKKQSLEVYQKGVSAPVVSLRSEIVANPEISGPSETRRLDQ